MKDLATSIHGAAPPPVIPAPGAPGATGAAAPNLISFPSLSINPPHCDPPFLVVPAVGGGGAVGAAVAVPVSVPVPVDVDESVDVVDVVDLESTESLSLAIVAGECIIIVVGFFAIKSFQVKGLNLLSFGSPIHILSLSLITATQCGRPDPVIITDNALPLVSILILATATLLGITPPIHSVKKDALTLSPARCFLA